MPFCNDHVGNMFGCLPAYPTCAAFAGGWLILGLQHMLVIVLHFAVGMESDIDDYGKQRSCQGSACHAEWRETFGTCKSERKSTFRAKYCIVATTAALAAYIGLAGLYNLDHVKIKAFGWYQVAMMFLFAAVLLGDLVYADICDFMPLNMAKDVMFFVPPAEIDRLKAQGWASIDELPVEKIKQILRYDLVVVYGLVMGCLILLGIYVGANTILVAEKVISGPLGLGMTFKISYSTRDDIEEAKKTAAQILNGLDYSQTSQSYGSFPALNRAQKWPYLNFSRQAEPSSFGATGAPRKEDVHDPRFVEYLGVYGL